MIFHDPQPPGIPFIWMRIISVCKYELFVSPITMFHVERAPICTERAAIFVDLRTSANGEIVVKKQQPIPHYPSLITLMAIILAYSRAYAIFIPSRTGICLCNLYANRLSRYASSNSHANASHSWRFGIFDVGTACA